jgi:hypothetical protein
MQAALERVLSDGPGLANRAGIAAPLLDLIARDMLRFEPAHRGLAGLPVVVLPAAFPASELPARLLGYVVDGYDPQILARIQASASYSFSSHDQDRKARGIRWQIYDRWEELPPTVLLRFAQVLGADSALVAGNAALDLSTQHPWAETLVRDLVGLPVSHHLFSELTCCPHGKASIERLAALLETDGLAVEAFLRSALTSKLGSTRGDSANFVTTLRGFGAALAQHKPALAPLFRDPAFPQRLRALSLLSRAGADAHVAFADELVDLALDASRQIRDGAWPLARKLGAHAGPRARHQAVEAAPERRVLALRLMWEADLPGDRACVRERGTADKAESVRKAVAKLVSTEDGAADHQIAAEGQHVAALRVPEVVIDTAAPTSPEARELLRAWLATADAAVTPAQRRFLSGGQQHALKPLSDLVEEIVARIEVPDETAARAGGTQAQSRFWMLWNDEREVHQGKNIARWLAAAGVQLIHLVRLLRLTGQIEARDGREWMIHYPAGLALRKSIADLRRGSLLEFARVCEAEGIPVSIVIKHWYRSRGWLTRGWPDAAVWPFFAAYPEALDPGFDTSSPYAKEWDFELLRVFDALATFPALPPERVGRIVEAALGTSKQVRASAQRVLDKHPDRLSFSCEGLTNGRAEVRIAAAQWLTRLKDPAAIEPLEQAFKREKNDAAQGAILTALEATGAPVDRYLSTKGLAKTAEAGLRKGIPQELVWFPFDQLPRVHWEGKGGPVTQDILRWFLVQSCRLKTPEPSALLRRYCAMLRTADREALGAFVLSAWIAQDLHLPSREVAEQQAQQLLGLSSQYSHGSQSSSAQDMTDELVGHFLRRPSGSAIGSKGVLALAAACRGAGIVPMVNQYLQEWYGHRAAQGKALIQMLAWVEHPTAIQLMLSVGSRFRTKGFQDEATKQAELLAERKGWTLDELADRTVPTAGFDENGVLDLDYGGRKLIARLREDMTIGVETTDGKPLGALPDARKDDDETKVKEAKKRLTAARKELKGILTLQKDRLYEAMCTGRTWRYEDWSTYLIQHPVVRRHCHRLVWRALENGKTAHTFRALDDGTLTDADDNRVALEPHAGVGLAHETNCDAPVREAWLKHFQDYGLAPLFQQFGKGSYVLPDDRREATSLGDFKGHMLDAFKLRGAAGKFGYMRGLTEDGGWFFAYFRRFASLGVEAVVGFSGNTLPEENRKVALTGLSFRRGGGVEVPLGEVPAGLLSECWNDMRLVAAEGSGFDPNWQSKVEG